MSMEDTSALKEYYDIAKLCQEQCKSIARQPSHVLTAGTATFPITGQETSETTTTGASRFTNNSGDLFNETYDSIDSDAESNSTASSLLYYLLDTKPGRYAKLKEKYKTFALSDCAFNEQQQPEHTLLSEKQNCNRLSGSHNNGSAHLPSEKRDAGKSVGVAKISAEKAASTFVNLDHQHCSVGEDENLLDIYVNKKINLLEKVAILDCIGRKSIDSDMESNEFDSTGGYKNHDVETEENAPILDSTHFGSGDHDGCVNSDTESCLNNTHPINLGENKNGDQDSKINITKNNDLDSGEESEIKSKVSKYISNLPDGSESGEQINEDDVTKSTECDEATEIDGSDLGAQRKSLDLIRSGLSLIKENLQIDKLCASENQNLAQDTTKHVRPESSSYSTCQAEDFDRRQFGCHRYPLTSQSSVFEEDYNQSWQQSTLGKSMFTDFNTIEENPEIYASIPASCVDELLSLQNEMSNVLAEVQSSDDLRKVKVDSNRRSKSLGNLLGCDEGICSTKDTASYSRAKDFASRLKQITARIGKLTTEGYVGERNDLPQWRYPRQDDMIAQLQEIRAESLRSEKNTKRLQPIEDASVDAQDTCLLLFMHDEMTSYKKRLETKHEQIKQLCASKEEAVWKAVRETEEENASIRKELYELRESHLRLKQDFHTQAIIFNKLQGQLQNRNKYNQDMYLKMYEKGKNAAWIERQEQLEELIENSPSQVNPTELIQKLKHTEQELTRWQTLVRRESYEEGEYLKPQTESDATLKFMKDSMFHYLTNPENSALHLRAIIRMLGFTDDEKTKIAAARKKVKSK